MDRLKQLKDILQAAMAKVPEIESSTFGNSKRIANAVGSNRVYPAAHFSYPRIGNEYNRNRTIADYQVQISVGESVEEGNDEQREQVEGRTLDLLYKLCQSLATLALEEDTFEFAFDGDMEIMEPRTSDNEHGWFVEVSIKNVECPWL